MQRHKVRSRQRIQHILEINITHFFSGLALYKGVKNAHLHIKRGTELCYLTPNISKTQNYQHFVYDVHRSIPVADPEVTCLRLINTFDNVLCAGKQQRDRMLSHRSGICGGTQHNRDPPLCSCLNIHAVIPHTGAGDHLQLLAALDRFSVDLPDPQDVGVRINQTVKNSVAIPIIGDNDLSFPFQQSHTIPIQRMRDHYLVHFDTHLSENVQIKTTSFGGSQFLCINTTQLAKFVNKFYAKKQRFLPNVSK